MEPRRDFVKGFEMSHWGRLNIMPLKATHPRSGPGLEDRLVQMRHLLKRAAFLPALALSRIVLNESDRNRLLATWATPLRRGMLDRVLFKPVFLDWLQNIYLAEPDPEKREAMKAVCMGGDAGTAWADHYEATPIDRSQMICGRPFDEAWPIYPAMDRLLKAASDDTIVIQLGASSGRETAYFAALEPRLSYVGTDIDDAIIGRAAEKHARQNVTFAVSLAHRVLEGHQNDRPIILFSNGSLQYVQPEHMAEMFRAIKARGNVTITLVESWRPNGFAVAGSTLTRDRGNFSFSHDYGEYAVQAGLEVLEHRLVTFSGDENKHYYLTAQAV
jgi:hypothetical protein